MKRTFLLVLLDSVLLLSVLPAEQAGGLEAAGFAGPQLGQAVAEHAQSYLHVGYSYGGSDAGGMDCSGLVYRVFLEAADLRLPRGVAELYGYGNGVDGPLLPGDLVFFNTDGGEPSHVGIYIGDRRMIHAASRGPETGVIVSSLEEPYYRQRYLRGRRVISAGRPEMTILLSADPPVQQLEQTAPPGYPLKILLSGSWETEQFLTVRFEKEGRAWFSRRLRLQPPAGFLWFTPPEGNWRVVCEDTEGNVVGICEFTAGRKP
jgi:probable lipoprotein NlpC